MLFLKAIVNNNIVFLIPVQIDNIKQKYNIPSSMLSTNVIMKKLNKIKAKQTVLRDAYKYIFDFSSKYKGTIISCNYKNKSFVVKFKNIKVKKIAHYIEKKYSLTSSVINNKIVTIGFDI